VLILWGDKDEALIKELPDNERKFITGDLEVKHFSEYGHNMFHANPEGCWKSIKQWLDKQ
jgi:pimeloyl-ACP methyl ester carboxylesterase